MIFLANDAKSHLNLKKMVEATKKDKKIFQQLAEPLLDGQIEITPPWPTTYDILTIVSMGIAIVAMIGCILLGCKVRKLHISFMMLQTLHQAKSEEIPTFIYKALTTAPPAEESNSWLLQEFTLLHACILLATLTFILFIVLIVWLYHRKSRKHTYLALELSTGGQCVVIPQLSLCPSYYDIRKPDIGTITVSDFPYTKLHTDWTDFHVTDKRTEKTFPVPKVLDISMFTGYKITSILKQPFSAYVTLIHNNRAQFLH